MRRLMPILLTPLLLGANTLVNEKAFTESQEAAPGASAPGGLAAAEKPKAKGPHNALFDQLIGTWDVHYEIVDKDGNVRRNRGQVRYSWILDGNAVQEIWFSDSESKHLQPFGTMIDFYDRKRERWTAVWIYPGQGITSIMTGGIRDGSLVLTGRNESGALERWSTSVAQPNSIAVSAEVSGDEGKTWRPLGVSYLERYRK
jgi:hypothetical protein